jgi:hypothetical protein
MVSITLSVPEEVKKRMNEYSEINWSGFVRASIEAKLDKLIWREEMLKKLEAEEEFDEWAVDFGRKIKKDASKKLQRNKAKK